MKRKSKYQRGEIVDIYGGLARLLRRRRVTMDAMPRYDEWEWWVEPVDGSRPYWCGQSDLAKVKTPEQGAAV